MKHIAPLILLFCLGQMQGQYSFSGKIENNGGHKDVYLSIIEDYRKLSRVYLEQVIRKTSSDSLGFFHFEGENLSANNQIYRIHVDDCSDSEQNANHFFGQCAYSKSILFLANNRDTIAFPLTSANEMLCEITSTNPKSDVFLQIDALKEEMIYDFTEYRSEASRKINSKKWFASLQEFGKTAQEPQAELYVYDFLSDRRNETYRYYLQDLGNNPYYDNLLERLKNSYPNAYFTQLYQAEISADKQLASYRNPDFFNWKWVLGLLLALSLGLNIIMLMKHKTFHRKRKTTPYEKLTQQEQKIVAQILANKTNKEIASELFISLSTVKTHINNLYKKLNVATREDIKRIFP